MDSKEATKCFDSKASIFYYAAHRKCFDWIVARNRQKMYTVTHDNVFALSNDTKSSLLKGANCVEMIDTWQF